MATKTPASKTSTDLDADIARGLKKSSLTIKRLAGDKASVRADFHFRGLRYQMEGLVDLAHGRPEPFKHQLSGPEGTVFEATAIRGQQASRMEIQFGKAVQGPRALVLTVEPLREGSLVGGFADGAELLPLRSSACSCSATPDAPQRPLLAWQPDGSTRPITMALPKAVRSDLQGLTQVMQTTVARMGHGIGLGDILDVLDWVFCEIGCIGELLWCWIRQPNIPSTTGIFDILCMVVWSSCNMICRINRPF